MDNPTDEQLLSLFRYHYADSLPLPYQNIEDPLLFNADYLALLEHLYLSGWEYTLKPFSVVLSRKGRQLTVEMPDYRLDTKCGVVPHDKRTRRMLVTAALLTVGINPNSETIRGEGIDAPAHQV